MFKKGWVYQKKNRGNIIKCMHLCYGKKVYGEQQSKTVDLTFAIYSRKSLLTWTLITASWY